MNRLNLILSAALMAAFVTPAFAGGGPSLQFSVSKSDGTMDIGRNRGTNLAGQYVTTQTLPGATYWGAVNAPGATYDSYTLLAGYGTVGNFGGAYDINNVGTVAGYAYYFPGWQNDAVIWEGGSIVSLGIKAGIGSQAYSINDLGEVVGVAEEFLSSGSIKHHAFYWDQTHAGFDLNDCLDASGTGWYLSAADGINANGTKIYGRGMLNGEQTYFTAQRITPAAVPEPSSALLLTGVIPLICLLRRSNR